MRTKIPSEWSKCGQMIVDFAKSIYGLKVCGKSCRFLKAFQNIIKSRHIFKRYWHLSYLESTPCQVIMPSAATCTLSNGLPHRKKIRAQRNWGTSSVRCAISPQMKRSWWSLTLLRAKQSSMFSSYFWIGGRSFLTYNLHKDPKSSEMFPKHPRFADLVTMMYKFQRKWNVYTSSTVASPPRAQQVQLRGRGKVMMPGNNGQRKTARPTDEGRNWGKMLLIHDYSKDSRDQIWCNNWISRNYDHDQHVKSKHHKAGTAMMTMMLA